MQRRLRCLPQRWCVLVVAVLISWACPASAQAYNAEQPLGSAAQETPAYLAHAGLEQRLGASLPMNAPYTDESGRTGPLREWFGGRPVVFAEVYYHCAMLCPQVLRGLADGLKQTSLVAGKDYDVLVFSIDPQDRPSDALSEKKTFVQEARLDQKGAGATHFLTGPQASIDAVSASTGFHFVRVPGPDGKLDQFAHSSVILFATPEGRISRYLSGIDYPARDLRMALLDADHHKISNPVDFVLTYCCNYSPSAGRYTVSVLRILSLAGFVAILGLVGILILLTRKPAGTARA